MLFFFHIFLSSLTLLEVVPTLLKLIDDQNVIERVSLAKDLPADTAQYFGGVSREVAYMDTTLPTDDDSLKGLILNVCHLI